jgi:amino-acid N-acetyltransferase
MTVRPGQRQDQTQIDRLVRGARLNPFDLDWRRFRVIEQNGRLLAVGQVRVHRDGSRELASIVTVPEGRGQGLATTLIRNLLANETGPVYLTCRPELSGFYERLGFEIWQTGLPPYFQTIARISRLAQRVLGRPLIIVMRFSPKEGA